MNDLKNTIKEDLKTAMKAGDAARVSVIRMLLSSIANKEIELGKKEIGLSDDQILGSVKSEAKKRKDAVSEFQKADRNELADKEKEELLILEKYLPPEISDEEISIAVKKGIEESQAKGPTDFGKAMKIIAPILKGKASGDRIAEAVRKFLKPSFRNFKARL